ncbi:hypothetical protein J1N35_011327 [Gossypium stocksii]|uniref:Aminotransferase-like plant mobile domain-containing protein n=1 Tax=Gossypium stocksii TaxID=47602 RepID=A0A9D3W1W5_9ROSI|nr:hypothetical protein J1N35_011327 [Gossypium stocksii]
MAGELIHIDNKQISVEQMKMSVDRVLQCYIRNMSGPPSPLIEIYLREAELKYNRMLKIYLIKWNHLASYVGLPISIEDIRLLLDQRSEAQFQWTPYEDPTIWAVILDGYFQNPNIWHVKVSLVNFATVEMHQSDRVLRHLDSDNLFLSHLKCSMMSTKSTYGSFIRIDRDSGQHISKCGTIGMITYLFGN